MSTALKVLKSSLRVQQAPCCISYLETMTAYEKLRTTLVSNCALCSMLLCLCIFMDSLPY